MKQMDIFDFFEYLKSVSVSAHDTKSQDLENDEDTESKTDQATEVSPVEIVFMAALSKDDLNVALAAAIYLEEHTDAESD